MQGGDFAATSGSGLAAQVETGFRFASSHAGQPTVQWQVSPAVPLRGSTSRPYVIVPDTVNRTV